MFRSFLIFLALNTASVYLVHQVLDGFVIEGGAIGFVIVGIVIGTMNVFVKPIIKVLALPFIFLTVGLFVIVVNALILWLSVMFMQFLDLSAISLTVDGLFTYITAVVLLGILNYLFQKLLR